MFWGKIIGLIVGTLAMGAWQGALLGVVAGALYDLYYERRIYPSLKDVDWWQSYSIAIVRLFACLAKADGYVSTSEIRAFKREFDLRKEDEKILGQLFDQARVAAGHERLYMREVSRLCEGRQLLLLPVLEAMYKVSMANGSLADAQLQIIGEAARIWQIEPYAHQQLESRLGITSSARYSTYEDKTAGRSAIGDEDPYQVLGLKKGADADAVRKAYHQLVRDNHPDRLHGDGATSKAVAAAEEKLARLNAAYAALVGKK